MRPEITGNRPDVVERPSDGGGSSFGNSNYRTMASTVAVELLDTELKKIPLSTTEGTGLLGTLVGNDFVVPVAGWYVVSAYMHHDGDNTSGHRRGQISVDNVVVYPTPSQDGAVISSGSAPNIEGVDSNPVSATLNLAAGQTISLWGWQNSGTAKNVDAGAWMNVVQSGINSGAGLSSEAIYRATRGYGGMFISDPVGGYAAPFVFAVTAASDTTFSNNADFVTLNDANVVGTRNVWRPSAALKNMTVNAADGTTTINDGYAGAYYFAAEGNVGTDNANEFLAFRLQVGGTIVTNGSAAGVRVANVQQTEVVTGIGPIMLPSGVPISLAVAGQASMNVEVYRMSLSLILIEKTVI